MISTNRAVTGARRLVRVVQGNPRPFLAGLAVCASALVLLATVALPARLENEARPHVHANFHDTSRIAELARLQGDSLLAAACWRSACAPVQGN